MPGQTLTKTAPTKFREKFETSFQRSLWSNGTAMEFSRRFFYPRAVVPEYILLQVTVPNSEKWRNVFAWRMEAPSWPLSLMKYELLLAYLCCFNLIMIAITYTYPDFWHIYYRILLLASCWLELVAQSEAKTKTSWLWRLVRPESYSSSFLQYVAFLFIKWSASRPI